MLRRSVFLPTLLACLALAPRAFAQAPEPEAEAEASQPAPPRASDFEQRLRAQLARSGGLTADEAGRRAARTSSDVRAKNAAVIAAAADVDKALIAYAPRLTLSARYVRLSPIDAPSLGPDNANLVVTPAGEGPLPPGAPLVGVPGSALSFPVILNQYSLQANLTVPVSDYLLRTAQSHAAATHSRRAAELGSEAARRNARTNGKLLYYDWVRARLQQVVTLQGLEQAEEHVKAARALREADRASLADVMNAQAQQARAELLLEKSKTFTLVAEDRLRTAMHDTSSHSYAIGEDLLGPLPQRPTGDLASLMAEANAKRPELKALGATSKALAEQKKATRGAGYPRLDAFGNAYYQNPNSRYVPQSEEWKASWDLGLQLSWTPNDTATTGAAAAALEAKRAQLHAEQAGLRDALRGEVFAAYRGLREAEIAIRTAERGLSSAEEAYRVRAEQYRYGRATSVELTDAESVLIRARLDLVNARVDWHVAREKLIHAVGRDTRN